MNVDATFSDENFETGLGMILYDEKRYFVMGRSEVFPGKMDTDLGEAIGFAKALSWAEELGLPNVVLGTSQMKSRIILL